jgi:rhodanese-related sulfurtransferase
VRLCCAAGEVESDASSKPYVHIPVPGPPFNDFSVFSDPVEKLPDKSAPIICFCAVGGRVMGAKKALEAAGYTNVLNAGGLCDLKETGLA